MLHKLKTAECDRNVIFSTTHSRTLFLQLHQLSVSTVTCTLIFHFYFGYQGIPNSLQVIKAVYYGWFIGIRPFKCSIFPFSYEGNADINLVLGAFIGQVNWALSKKKAPLWLRCYAVHHCLMLSYRKKDRISLKPMFEQINGDNMPSLDDLV